jgi:hypothetical protein
MAHISAKVNPLNFPVTITEITVARKAFEQLPLVITEGVIDADDYAEKAFDNALLVWGMLPLEERKWKMADNVSKVDCPTIESLQALRNSMLVARGLRAAQLHAAADALKAIVNNGGVVTRAELSATFSAI